jgi:hypothetical protein
MKRIILFLMILVLSSCNDEDPGSQYIGVDFNIIVKDQDGRNLLNPDKEYSYPSSGIRLYTKDSNGEMESMTLNISENGIQSYARIKTGDDQKNNERCTMYLELKEGDIEEIDYEIEYHSSSISLDKLWYKNELIYDNHNTSLFAEVTIKKDIK